MVQLLTDPDRLWTTLPLATVERRHVHSISDFNWSSCFTLLFIQDELYLD